jgi:ABC-type Zn uptake system ZnuABC Zn-binding protein ZnuA
MEHHKEIVEYFQRKGVSAIFLLRRNFLRRVVSVLANSYDKYAKPLNGTHKSHVHSTTEVSSRPLFLYQSAQERASFTLKNIINHK